MVKSPEVILNNTSPGSLKTTYDQGRGNKIPEVNLGGRDQNKVGRSFV